MVQRLLQRVSAFIDRPAVFVAAVVVCLGSLGLLVLYLDRRDGMDLAPWYQPTVEPSLAAVLEAPSPDGTVVLAAADHSSSDPTEGRAGPSTDPKVDPDTGLITSEPAASLAAPAPPPTIFGTVPPS